MTIERKVGMGIAGQPSGGATDVADVFSTYVYTGTGSTAQTINNGIDLAGEGGLTWIKSRSNAYDHVLINSESGITKSLFSNDTSAEDTNAPYITSYNSNGFTLAGGGWYGTNETNFTYASWTFRNSKKFFKSVTFSYGGSSASPTVVTHDLGCTVGMAFVKQTNGTQNWHVQHKDVTGNGNNGALNLTIAFAGGNGQSTSFTSITDTQATFGAAASFPAGTYVAYFFADNSSEDAEDQMIKCGSYTGSSSDVTVSLGWEPQFVLIKNATSSSNWAILDTLRGMPHGDGNTLVANSSAAENGVSGVDNFVNPIADGFIAKSGKTVSNQNSSSTHIYMAIRAPMMVEPEAATDVFAMYSGGTSQSYPQYLSGFPVDMALHRATTSTNSELATRLLGAGLLKTNATDAWGASGAYAFDYSNGWFTHGSPTYFTNYKSWMWKRAKGFMDCVAYSGSGVAKTEAHSLGVAPEMIWVKSRANAKHWAVYHPSSHAAGNTLFISTGNGGAGVDGFQSTAVSDTTFNVTTADYTNESGWTYIAYLFATLAGISKVGSYTGNGSSQTINCGFSAGARFILIKRIGADGNWYVWDSARGIVAGNDPHLSLNTSSAQVTSDDSIDPHNSGFIVNQVSATNINVSSGTYIFYAIA